MATKALDLTGLTYYNTKLNEKLDEKFVEKDGEKVLSENDFTTALKDKLDGLSNYTLPTASADVKGGVKVGAGLKIAEDTLSATAQSWDQITGKPEQFTPSTHTHKSTEVTDLDTTIQKAIAGSTHLTRQIVENLEGVEAPSENVVYMVKKTAGKDKNAYDEYMYIESEFELIGDSAVDLTGYMKTADLQAITNEEIDGIFSA